MEEHNSIGLLRLFPPSTLIAILKAILTDYKDDQLEEISETVDIVINTIISELNSNIGIIELLLRISK